VSSLPPPRGGESLRLALSDRVPLVNAWASSGPISRRAGLRGVKRRGGVRSSLQVHQFGPSSWGSCVASVILSDPLLQGSVGR